MKLGEMLVRDGHLTESQVEYALARQAQVGGRLGTVLVEMGFIDVDTLTVYLGIELSIPIATGATLERAKRTAVRLLSPAQAQYYRCIPIILQDRQLIAAVDDPHDIEAFDELSQITGYRVLPRIAPEIRIFYYLERYYGVPRPARYSAFGDRVRGGMPARGAANLPALPLPGLPPVSASPAPQLPSRPIAVTSTAADTAQASISTPDAESVLDIAGPISPDGAALTSDAENLVNALDADVADRAEEAPRADPRPARLDTTQTRASREAPEPMALGPAVAAMRAASRRGDVADAIMSYAVSLFDVCALFVIRDNMAFGWKASGLGLDRDRIEALLIPLDPPSMFRIAIHRDNLFHAPPFPATLHSYLYRVLRCPPPAMATVTGIVIGKRPVNLLYGHCTQRGELTDEEIAGLRTGCRAASAAYVQLITTSKRGPRPGPR